MSSFDQDQPIDYSNKYNENIGSISPPKLRKSNMINPNRFDGSGYLQSSSKTNRYSEYDQFDEHDESDNNYLVDDFEVNNIRNSSNFNPNFNHFNDNNVKPFYYRNQSSESQNFQMNNDSFTKSKDDWSKSFRTTTTTNHNNFMTPNDHHFYINEDVTDSMTVYQTENTPICLSNGSPLSNLSLEFLPSINNMNAKSTSNQTIQNGNYQNMELNSSGDSILNFNMEGSPIYFSDCTPLSELSLTMDGELTPNMLELINNRTTKFKQPIDQDITSIMSNMSIENSNNLIKTRSPSRQSTENTTNKFGHLNSQREDEFSLLDYETKSNSRCSNHLNNNNNNQANNLAPKFLNSADEQRRRQNSRLDDFESNRYSPLNSFEQDRESPVDGFEQGFDDIEELYLDKCISFGRLSTQRFVRSTAPISANKPKVKLGSETDLSTTITDFSTDYSRSMYKIDGEEENEQYDIPHVQMYPTNSYNNNSDNFYNNHQEESMQNQLVNRQKLSNNSPKQQVKPQKPQKVLKSI